MVRTISGGGIRRLSPGVFSLFIVERIGTDVAVVRTISGGGTRRISPGVFSVSIVISGWIGTCHRTNLRSSGAMSGSIVMVVGGDTVSGSCV